MTRVLKPSDVPYGYYIAGKRRKPRPVGFSGNTEHGLRNNADK